MADIGGSSNDAFMSGVAHQVNPARSNLGSITLNSSSEQSAVGPHSALAATVGPVLRTMAHSSGTSVMLADTSRARCPR